MSRLKKLYKKARKKLKKAGKALRPGTLLRPLVEKPIKKKIQKQLVKVLDETKLSLDQQQEKDKEAIKILIDQKIQELHEESSELQQQLSQQKISNEQLSDVCMWVLLFLLNCKSGDVDYLCELLDFNLPENDEPEFPAKLHALEFLFMGELCPLETAFNHLHEYQCLDVFELLLPIYIDSFSELSETNQKYYQEFKNKIANRIGSLPEIFNEDFKECDYILVGLNQLIEEKVESWKGKSSFIVMNSEPNNIDRDDIISGNSIIFEKKGDEWLLHYPADSISSCITLLSARGLPNVSEAGIYLYRSSDQAIFALVIHRRCEIIKLNEHGFDSDQFAWPKSESSAINDLSLFTRIKALCKWPDYQVNSVKISLDETSQNQLEQTLGNAKRRKLQILTQELLDQTRQIVPQSINLPNKNNPLYRSELRYGEYLQAGEELDDVHGLFRFTLHENGSGVVYERLPDQTTREIFKTPVLGSGEIYHLAITSDGNIEIKGEKSAWKSEWPCTPCTPEFFSMQGDAHIVVYGKEEGVTTPLYRSCVSYHHLHFLAKMGDCVLYEMENFIKNDRKSLNVSDDLLGHKPLDYALSGGHVEAAKLIMDKGGKSGRLPIHKSTYVIELTDNALCIFVNDNLITGFNREKNSWIELVKSSSQKNYQNEYGLEKHESSPLELKQIHVNNSQFEKIKHALQKDNADLDALLSEAAKDGRAEAAHFFILLGADPDTQTGLRNASINELRTPLMWAISANSPPIVSLLMKAGANCKLADAKEMTAWHFAFNAFKQFPETALAMIQIMSHGSKSFNFHKKNAEGFLPQEMVEFDSVLMPMMLALNNTLTDLNHDKCFNLPLQYYRKSEGLDPENENQLPDNWWHQLLDYLGQQRPIESRELCRQVGGAMIYLENALPTDLQPYWSQYVIIEPLQEVYYISGCSPDYKAELVSINNFNKLMQDLRIRQCSPSKIPLTYYQHKKIFSGENYHQRKSEENANLTNAFKEIYLILPVFQPDKKELVSQERLFVLLDELVEGHGACTPGYEDRVKLAKERAYTPAATNMRELFYLFRKRFAESVYHSAAVNLKFYAHLPTDVLGDVHDRGLFSNFASVALNIPGLVPGEAQLTERFFYKANVARILLNNLHETFRPYSLAQALTQTFRESFEKYIGFKEESYNDTGEEFAEALFEERFENKFKWLLPGKTHSDLLNHMYGDCSEEDQDRICIVREPAQVVDFKWDYVAKLMLNFLIEQGYFKECGNPFKEIKFADQSFRARHGTDVVDYYENHDYASIYCEEFIKNCCEKFPDENDLPSKLLLAAVKKSDVEMAESLIIKEIDLDYAKPYATAPHEEVESYYNFLEKIKYKIVAQPQLVHVNDDQPPQIEVKDPIKEQVAKINLKWFTERTALMIAIANGSMPFVSFLLDNGALVNYQNSEGWTALHEAAFLSRKNPQLANEIIEILFLHGANPLAKASLNEIKDSPKTILPVQLTWPETEAFEVLWLNTYGVKPDSDCSHTLESPVKQTDHPSRKLKEVAIPHMDVLLPYLALAFGLIQGKLNFKRAIKLAKKTHAALTSDLPKAFWHRKIVQTENMEPDYFKEPGLYLYCNTFKTLMILIVHDHVRHEVHQVEQLLPYLSQSEDWQEKLLAEELSDELAISILSACQYPYSTCLNMKSKRVATLLELFNHLISHFAKDNSLFYSDIGLEKRLNTKEWQPNFDLAAAMIKSLPGVNDRIKIAVLTAFQVISEEAFNLGNFSSAQQLSSIYQEGVFYFQQEIKSEVIQSVLRLAMEKNQSKVKQIAFVAEETYKQIDLQYEELYKKISCEIKEKFKTEEKKAIKKACKNIDIAVCGIALGAVFAPLLGGFIIEAFAIEAVVAGEITLSGLAVDAISKALLQAITEFAFRGNARHLTKNVAKGFALNYVPNMAGLMAGAKNAPLFSLDAFKVAALKSLVRESLQAILESNKHLESIVAGTIAGTFGDQLSKDIHPKLVNLFGSELVANAFTNALIASLRNDSIHIARNRKLTFQDALCMALLEGIQTFMGECIAKKIGQFMPDNTAQPEKTAIRKKRGVLQKTDEEIKQENEADESMFEAGKKAEDIFLNPEEEVKQNKEENRSANTGFQGEKSATEECFVFEKEGKQKSDFTSADSEFQAGKTTLKLFFNPEKQSTQKPDSKSKQNQEEIFSKKSGSQVGKTARQLFMNPEKHENQYSNDSLPRPSPLVNKFPTVYRGDARKFSEIFMQGFATTLEEREIGKGYIPTSMCKEFAKLYPCDIEVGNRNLNQIYLYEIYAEKQGVNVGKELVKQGRPDLFDSFMFNKEVAFFRDIKPSEIKGGWAIDLKKVINGDMEFFRNRGYSEGWINELSTDYERTFRDKFILNPDFNYKGIIVWNTLRYMGWSLTAIGVTLDGVGLYREYQISTLNGNREAARIAGGWSGALAVGIPTAELCAKACRNSLTAAAVAGFIGALIGSAAGYFAGGTIGTKIHDGIKEIQEKKAPNCLPEGKNSDTKINKTLSIKLPSRKSATQFFFVPDQDAFSSIYNSDLGKESLLLLARTKKSFPATSHTKLISPQQARNFIENVEDLRLKKWWNMNTFVKKIDPSCQRRITLLYNFNLYNRGDIPQYISVMEAASALDCTVNELLAPPKKDALSLAAKDFRKEAIKRSFTGLQEIAKLSQIPYDLLVKVINQGSVKFTQEEISSLVNLKFSLPTLAPYADLNVNLMEFIDPSLNQPSQEELSWYYKRKGLTKNMTMFSNLATLAESTKIPLEILKKEIFLEKGGRLIPANLSRPPENEWIKVLEKVNQKQLSENQLYFMGKYSFDYKQMQEFIQCENLLKMYTEKMTQGNMIKNITEKELVHFYISLKQEWHNLKPGEMNKNVIKEIIMKIGSSKFVWFTSALLTSALKSAPLVAGEIIAEKIKDQLDLNALEASKENRELDNFVNRFGSHMIKFLLLIPRGLSGALSTSMLGDNPPQSLIKYPTRVIDNFISAEGYSESIVKDWKDLLSVIIESQQTNKIIGKLDKPGFFKSKPPINTSQKEIQYKNIFCPEL